MTLQSRARGGQNFSSSSFPPFLKGKKQRGQGRAHLAQRAQKKQDYNNDKRLAVLNDSEKIPRG